MTDKTNKKEFDCVRTMRRFGPQQRGDHWKTHEELADWFNAHHYSDPVLQRFASRRKKRDPSGGTEKQRPYRAGASDVQHCIQQVRSDMASIRREKTGTT